MKQVIVIRKDLNMSKGKIAAQAAHAAVAIVLTTPMNKLAEWIATGQTKIVVSVDSEAQLVAGYELAQRSDWPCTLITDAGHTEIPAGTKTCYAIGPAPDKEVDAFTGHLKLL